jgi:hypothetical protein
LLGYCVNNRIIYPIKDRKVGLAQNNLLDKKEAALYMLLGRKILPGITVMPPFQKNHLFCCVYFAFWS